MVVILLYKNLTALYITKQRKARRFLFRLALFSCSDDLNAVVLSLFRSPCAEVPEMGINGIHGTVVVAVYIIIPRHGDFPSFRRSPDHESTVSDRLVFFLFVAILPRHTH
jgi:hypothetical protein